MSCNVLGAAGLKKEMEALGADLTCHLEGQEAQLELQRHQAWILEDAHRRQNDLYEAEVNRLSELSESLMCAAERAEEQVGEALALASRQHAALVCGHKAEVEELERRIRSANAAVRQGEHVLFLQSQKDQIRLGAAFGQLDHLALSHKEQTGRCLLTSVAPFRCSRMCSKNEWYVDRKAAI